jgi:flagellar motor switch/type III secretory pathway protein FliN
MAAEPPLPARAAAPAHESPPRASPEIASETALVPAPQVAASDDLIPPGSPLARLPVEVDVTVPVREFRLRNLLAMAPGLVIETEWAPGEDLPLAAGQVQLAWTEFEVVEKQLAVRITRLA